MLDARTGRLIIVCGLPGAGKTTLARALEEGHEAIRFCPDEWMDGLGVSLYDEEVRARVEALQWKLAQKLLKSGLTVIIEWGTSMKSERDALRAGARALGAFVELRYLAVALDVLVERIGRRGREDPPISRESIRQWFRDFEVPTEDEFASYDPPIDVERASPRSSP